jgi:hypothetical protein
MTLVAFDGLADVQRREFVSMAGLEPIMQGFGGKNATENLVNGMNAALASLKKYTSTLTFDPNRANEVFDRIEVWQQQNSEKLRDLMRKGAKTVPEQIAMSLGNDEAKSFIIASFSEAARGLKGWVGGAVAKNYKTNPAFTESMALNDRESRMITFASIVQLDQNGTLAKIFTGKSLGDDGLGAWPLAVIIVIAVAAVAAVSLVAYEAMRQRQQNKLIDQLCEQGSKDDCVQALKETIEEERSGGGGVVAQVAGSVGKWVGIGLVAYVGATFLLPKLLKGGRE